MEGELWGSEELVTLEEIVEAQKVLHEYKDILRTPLLKDGILWKDKRISLKLESLQTTGSFKIRGMRYKLHRSDTKQLQESGIVTFSAGNAGKAVSYLAQTMNVNAKVFMPDTAPNDRKEMMESMGSTVIQVPSTTILQEAAASISKEKRVLVHPFDDTDIIRGHASCGLEIIEDMPDVDIIVVCCGGGGLLSGIAAAVKLSGCKAKVIGVEPEGANSMWLSSQSGKAEWMPNGGQTNTIAHGLAPPFAGKACYNHVKNFVDEIVVVTDEELCHATYVLFQCGIVSEVSGAAAVAAVLSDKILDITSKNIVCTISGRNIDKEEYAYALSNGFSVEKKNAKMQ